MNGMPKNTQGHKFSLLSMAALFLSRSSVLQAFILCLFVKIIESKTLFSVEKFCISRTCFQPTTPQMTANVDLSSFNVAVLGGGNVGSILAQKLVESNKFKSVTIAARNPAKTTSELQARRINNIPVGPALTTIESSTVVILATPGFSDDEDMKSVAASLGDVTGKVIIDATNPFGPYADGLNLRLWDTGVSSGEKLQECLPKAKIYKSFNTVGLEHMKEALGKDMLIAGDPEPSSRAIAEGVVAAVGFKPFYVGPIRYARNLEAMAELWVHMVIPSIRARNASRNFWFSISGDP